MRMTKAEARRIALEAIAGFAIDHADDHFCVLYEDYDEDRPRSTTDEALVRQAMMDMGEKLMKQASGLRWSKRKSLPGHPGVTYRELLAPGKK